MNSTLPDLLQGLAAIAGMSLFCVAPGYLWGRLTGTAGLRSRSAAERFLWSVALSMPLVIALCALAGRLLSPVELNVLFAVVDLAAVVTLLLDQRRARRELQPPRCSRSLSSTPLNTHLMLALMALFGLYCVFAVTDIQIGHRVYVSTVIADWSVRVAMVEAAMRSAAAGMAVPPIDGLSTVSLSGLGHAPPLRYFYFWYVVVAHVARTFHLRAQPALAGSCAWAGWAFMATAFLALKYLVGVGTGTGARLRRSCFVLLVVGAVLGLDILPTALLWLSPKLHPYPEMEYWHQDRTPSFLGAVLYAPHHIAAFASLLAALLVLFITMRSGPETIDPRAANPRLPAGAVLPAALFAAVAFAAAAGTSLFPTFCFVFVLSLWAVDLLRRRAWRMLAALLVAGVLALLLARPYLHELSAGSSAASGFANLRWRNDDFLALYQGRIGWFRHHSAFVALLLRQPAVLLMDFFDLGFYTVVLWLGIRRLAKPGRLSLDQCALTALISGAAIPAFLLSSTATSGPNDLGVDAGFLLRFGLQLAAVPLLLRLRRQWQSSVTGVPDGPRLLPRWAFALTMVLFALGLSAQAYQVLSERFYYPVVGSGLAHKQMDAFTEDHLAERLYNIRAAYRQLDREVPPSAPDTEALQFNPVGPMQPAETIYANHQIAAWDTGCGTSYGGDYARCPPVFADLLFLYGNTEAGVLRGRAGNDRQDGAAARVATLADFDRTCQTLHLAAVVAESTDSIWSQPGSWVWAAPVFVANPTVRILRCPAA